MAKKPLACFICGKPTSEGDRVEGGQYAHVECLRENMWPPSRKTERV